MRATNCERNILSKMEIKLRSWLVLLACRIRRHCVKKNNLQEYSAHVAEQITMDHILKKIVVAVKKKRERKKKHVQIIPSMTPSESREQVGRKNLG
jgi:hypothetical protein